MSTKIHTAWAIKPKLDPWDVCMALRKTAAKSAARVLTTLYDDMVKRSDYYLSPTELKTFGTAKDFFHASDIAYRLYREQRGNPEKNFWDFDCSFTLRRADTGRWLIIPYPGSGVLAGSLSFMRKHKALVDYHYQNQADRPANITARQWDERARTWEPLLGDKRWGDRFNIDVMTVDEFFSVCPSTDRRIKAFVAADKKKKR